MLECGPTDSQKYLLDSPELGKWFIGDIKWNTKQKKCFLILSSCKAANLWKLLVSHV